MHRRVVALHSQSVTLIAADDERSRAVAAFVCGGLTSRACAQGADEHDAHELALHVGTPRPGHEAPCAEALMRALAMRLVGDYAQGLSLHAAAISHHERAILFPAISGAGKSTLAVHLAARGHGFLTDELVLVPAGTAIAHPLARPAHLKPGSAFLFTRWPELAASPHVWRYAGGALIAPSALGAALPSPLPLGAIVFPRFAPDVPSSAERLTAGLAAHSLLAALVNARNLPKLGVAECARLAASTPCYRLSYRTLDELEAQLDPILPA